MTTTIKLPLLDQVRIASPCPARWADMVGDAQVRHCAQCDLDVHNISAMTRDQAESVLAKLAEGCVCARFYRRSDGTIITRDCPIGLAAVRRRVLLATSRVAAALGLAVLAATAARASQDKSWGNWGWSMRLKNVQPVDWCLWKVRAGWDMVFPPKPGYGMLAGSMAMPSGKPPPATGKYGSFGPHGLEFERD